MNDSRAVALDMGKISLGHLVPESKEAIGATRTCGKEMEVNLKDSLWPKRRPFEHPTE